MRTFNIQQKFVDQLPKVDICLLGLQGSRMMGMQQTKDADYDYRGVYVAKNDDLLSLSKTKEHYVGGSSEDGEMDYAIFEVGKFIRLALKGNPSILHIFFVPKYNIKNDIGDYLIKHKEVFLGAKGIRAAFGGYALSQILYLNKSGQFKKSRKRVKHIRHCFRLFDCGADLLRTGEMKFPISKEKVEEYFELSKETDDDRLLRVFKERDKKFQAIKSCLPYEPDYFLANKILLRIRHWKE